MSSWRQEVVFTERVQAFGLLQVVQVATSVQVATYCAQISKIQQMIGLACFGGLAHVLHG